MLSVLVLLLLFSVGILLLLLNGTRSYQAITKRNQMTQNRRIGELYLANRFRQAANDQRIRIVEYDGVECLEILDILNDERYLTRVYCQDGWIRELFSLDSLPFSPEAGEKIVAAKELHFTRLGPLIRVDLTMDAGRSTLYFSVEEPIVTGGADEK